MASTETAETASAKTASPLVSVVIPCLNEAENIEACVFAAAEAMRVAGIDGEIVVADNGSVDGSAELAAAAGARVVYQPRRGYGSAYLKGFEEARGRYIVMADADLTYDFNEIPRFLATLEDGADMVIGNRMDNIQPGAMPWLHRYVGNPLLSGFLNLLYRTGVRDAHCGMRAVRRDVLPQLALRTPGMEFASEMVIRAAKERLDIRQFPIEYHPRGGESKLSTWRDGWRHLRFLLLHQPIALFIVPGLVLFVPGALLLLVSVAQLNVLGRSWQVHATIAGSLLTVVGTQAIGMGLAARTFAAYYTSDVTPLVERWQRRLRLERGLLAGGAILAVGSVLLAVILLDWANQGFGSLGEQRLVIFAATLVMVGVQVIFTSFLMSILALRRFD
jgi:hypothetical protein